MQKIAIITGASGGLGLDLVLLLAQKNYKVYATMRNLAKQDVLLAKAEQLQVVKNIEIMQLDVTKSQDVTSVFAQICAKHAVIDLLINNAGAGFLRNVEQASIEEINWVMDTNYHSVVYCTKAILAKMRAQKSGQIINISSIGGLIGQPFNELYCAAKFAVEGFTEALATYMHKGFNIKLNLVEPGGISSDFAKNVLSGVQQTGGILNDEYKPLLEQYIAKAQSRVMQSGATMYQTPQEVAEIIYEQVINNSTPPLRLRTSNWAQTSCELKTQGDPTGLKLVEYIENNFL